VPRSKSLPSTLKRSPAKAQRTFAKAHDAAVDQYGEGERAHRTAYAAVKQKFEKVGDHWERKEGGRSGKSDPGSGRRRKTYGGVDVVGHTKDELYERAKRLDVAGRSRMTKTELAEAIAEKQ
jgi:cation transport regulator ChaB